jgi:hypothetical protein
MNKQETAEFIAEKVLGWEWCKDCELWVADSAKHWNTEPLVADFIYSPEGFFAVWDAMMDKGLLALDFYTPRKDNKPVACELDTDIKQGIGKGKDRYEAFYNAVMEVWE